MTHLAQLGDVAERADREPARVVAGVGVVTVAGEAVSVVDTGCCPAAGVAEDLRASPLGSSSCLHGLAFGRKGKGGRGS